MCHDFAVGGQPRRKAVGVREDAQRRKEPMEFLICDLLFSGKEQNQVL
jgi:hypothetical protein